MNIQLALDRLTIDEAILNANKVKKYVDWIEVGTSLIKEFGINSVKEIRKAFPEKIILADVKTFDNAKYEFKMCFEAGADVATVMGTAPKVSIDICMEVARESGRKVMIDLLNTSDEKIKELSVYEDAIFCLHISKDLQEVIGEKQEVSKIKVPKPLTKIKDLKIAIAGGITSEFLENLKDIHPYVVIVGSAITKSTNPELEAKKIKELANRR